MADYTHLGQCKRTVILVAMFTPVLLLLAGCAGLPGTLPGGKTPPPPATAAKLVLSPAAVNFNNVPVGTSQQQTVTLSNSGTASAQVTQVSVSGAGFGVTAASLPWTLAPNQSQTFSVSFNPSAPGSDTGSISVTADSSAPPLALSGTGQGPQVGVNPSSLNFGTVQVGQSATQALTISNTGNAPAVISQFNLSDQASFSYSGVTLPLTVQPNASATVNVTYAPQTATDPTATLVLVANSAQPISVTLTGAATSPGQPTTWYIRMDGGTRQQCTGKTNAPYPGSGTNQACAFNHPFWLITANQSASDWSWSSAGFAGGDTVIFEPDANGKQGVYYMGTPASGGPGTAWLHCNGNGQLCYMPPPPSGTAAHPTRILGANAQALGGTCHNTLHNALINPPQFVGINQEYEVFTLAGANYLDMECLDIASDGTARVGISMTVRDPRGDTNNPYGPGPSNLTMRDIVVEGQGEGINGGHLNSSSSDVATFSDIYIRGNSGAGWDWDSGGCVNNCESAGTINISYADIEWNGCQEVIPTGSAPGAPPANGYTNCKDDSSGGYGDGFAIIAEGKITLSIDHSTFKYNTQDGLDALHFGDDPNNYPTLVTLTNSWSEGNMGQTFKLGAARSLVVRNNVSIDNCERLRQPFSPNPAGYNSALSDFCRAAGDQWSMMLPQGAQVTFQFNTTLGYGATMYDISCPTANNSGPAWTCTTGPNFIFEDNINWGWSAPGSTGRPGGFYLSNYPSDPNNNPFVNPGSKIDHNLWFNVKDNGFGSPGCPQVPQETNFLCVDPMLTAESNIDAINPAPAPGSPVLGAGVSVSGVTTDFFGVALPNPPAIGAVQLHP